MNTSKKLSPSVYTYILGIYKGHDKSLGEIASEARSFEKDLNCWIDELEDTEGRVR